MEVGALRLGEVGEGSLLLLGGLGEEVGRRRSLALARSFEVDDARADCRGSRGSPACCLHLESILVAGEELRRVSELFVSTPRDTHDTGRPWEAAAVETAFCLDLVDPFLLYCMWMCVLRFVWYVGSPGTS